MPRRRPARAGHLPGRRDRILLGGVALASTTLMVGLGLARAATPQIASGPRPFALNVYARAPLPVTAEEDPGLPNHTVFRPTDLNQAAGDLPVVLFGESGCLLSGGSFDQTLTTITSQGYVVIADNALKTPGHDTADRMMEGLNWILAENTRPGSQYQGKVTTSKIATSGHSCGGLLALKVGADPRVSTVLALDIGIFPDNAAGLAMGGAAQADLQNLKVPTLWMNSGPQDIAYPQAMQNFTGSPATLPAVFANDDLTERGKAAHVATWTEPQGGPMAAAAVQWLDFTLKGDTAAGQAFVGSCQLCGQPKWSVQSKNL